MVTPAEWGRVAVFALLVMALTVLPYAVGAAAADNAHEFTGFVLGADDGVSYIAKMRRGVEGHWRFYLFYTAEPHDAVPLTILPYIVPGQVMRLFTSPDNPNLYPLLVRVFHGMRLAFGALLTAVMYRFIAAFTAEPGARLLALVVATLGGGLGVVLLPFGHTPPEWFIPEGFTFLVLLTLPHVALARAAMLGGLLLLMERTEGYGWAVLAGVLWLITGLSVPFYLVVLYAVLGAWGLLLWARQRAFPTALFVRAVIAGGVTLPLFAFYLWAFQANPAFAQWSAQNSLPSPPPLHYLLAYAPYLVAGAFAVRVAWRAEGERYTLLLAWGLVGLLLVYLPINVQRRLAEGVIVPLTLLAVMGVAASGRRWAGGLLVVMTLPGMLFLPVGLALGVRSQPADLFTDADTLAALVWLDDHAIERERGAVVLARFDVGNRVPAYSGLRPYVGHGPETLRSRQKEADANAFFNGDWLPETQRGWLTASDNRIDYVLYGGGDAPPPALLLEGTLTEVYRADGITIYAVNR